MDSKYTKTLRFSNRIGSIISFISYALALLTFFKFAKNGHVIIGLLAAIFVLVLISRLKICAYRWLYSVNPLELDLSSLMWNNGVTVTHRGYNEDGQMAYAEKDENVYELVVTIDGDVEIARFYIDKPNSMAFAAVVRYQEAETPIILRFGYYYYFVKTKICNTEPTPIFVEQSTVLSLIHAIGVYKGMNPMDIRPALHEVSDHSEGKYFAFLRSKASTEISLVGYEKSSKKAAQ